MCGLFASRNVISIERDGIFLFCAVSYCTYDTEDKNSEIRFNIVNIIINEWEWYKDFIVDLSMVKIADDRKNLLPRDGEYGGSVEFICISFLLAN